MCKGEESSRYRDEMQTIKFHFTREELKERVE
jgi:hypothetical protein